MAASDVEAAERRLDGVAPGYLAQARQAGARLAPGPVDATDTRALLAEVAEAAEIDLPAPPPGSASARQTARVLVQRAVGWYLRSLGAQVHELGGAVVRFGDALVEQVESTAQRTERLGADVESLGDRVAALEELAGGRR